MIAVIWRVARLRTSPFVLLYRKESAVKKMDYPDISSMRMDYRGRGDSFDLEKCSNKNPLGLFSDWFSDACKDGQIFEPNSMALATSTPDGKPSVRMVLLKGFDENGFKFFTNYKSRKGQELDVNPEAALLFFWPTLHRQIRVEGRTEKLSEEESADYFDTRPRSSQISCYASEQSRAVANKQELESMKMKVEELFENKRVDKPKDWGGYVLKPRSIEFWQGQTDRFHDRIRFRLLVNGEKPDEMVTKAAGNGWYYERLCP